jgi:hypothetical protein
MLHPSLDAFLAQEAAALKRGPVALILIEDAVEIASTLTHHLARGFGTVLALVPDDIALPDLPGLADQRLRVVRFETRAPDAAATALNRVMDRADGSWLYWGYNAEYLFFPFSETRSIGEMLAFHAEERREAMPTVLVDLYADDLDRCPDAVDLARAHLDRTGYFAAPRPTDSAPDAPPTEIHGGLRWRFEDHVPPDRRSIGRIGIVRARRGRRMGADERFDDPALNTESCPWHRNLTAAVCSFRAAKALCRNPGSRAAIDSFHWRFSEPFRWQSRQLMDLGLMEPGQWF